ncbi:nicotinate (nicotinamide) nucleotide adenylyltransferase [candidate division KSB3 bacterium]|uniref:Probable nicotinate-nucleotide adenylyltransferase n=1 Tax=candidate division KSB3 bacterium TaxID=2044937 RepID=A0A2G6KKS6_9BACT|nr:MAG: nicotinate (nicotinamide) nucleotide adenylyltransferase [candidate division KSB3 bacterium]
MKIAILGGSFNPPHICHLFIIHYVLATSQLDQIWCLPCYKHAFGKALLPFHHRLEMCSLAVESFREDRVKVRPLECDRQGTSWTIDTILYVKELYPEYDFTWIIGSDVLTELDRWKDFERLQSLVSFFVVPRAGASQNQNNLNHTLGRHDHAPASPGIFGALRELKAQCRLLEEQGVFLPNISSSLIRERVKQHQPIHHLVPRTVEEYISTHRLYV